MGNLKQNKNTSNTMKIFAAAALVAYSAALKMNAMEGAHTADPEDIIDDGEWQDPCIEFSPCHEILERDPCAGSDLEDTDEWEACHADNAEWGAELQTCLEAKTEEQWAELVECYEANDISLSEFDSGSSEGDDDLAQSGDGTTVEDGPGSNWSEGEWQDPCEEFTPCIDIIVNDPCASFEDTDDWEDCHAGTEGQEWKAELEQCEADADSEDHADLLQCLEGLADDASISMDSSDGLAQTSGDDSGDWSSLDSSDWTSLDSSDDLAQTSGDDSGDDSGDESSEDLAQTSVSLPSSWETHPCEEFAVCDHEDPCADADDLSECHAGSEAQAWAAELEQCLENKTKQQWADEIHCWETHAPKDE